MTDEEFRPKKAHLVVFISISTKTRFIDDMFHSPSTEQLSEVCKSLKYSLYQTHDS